MCGIGIIAGGSSGRLEAALRSILKAHAHRGPDGDAVVMRDVVGFAHSRLAIIDLSAAAAEPMPNADGTAWLVFNGEIYNYSELRAELAGYPFRTRSDAEVLLAAYERWGRSVPRSLQRDVRVRHLGRADPNVVCRARSLRREAAVLRRCAGRRARDRERDQGAACRRRAARAGRRGVGDVFHPRHVTTTARRRSGAEFVVLPPGSVLRWSVERGLEKSRWYDVAARVLDAGEDERDEKTVTDDLLGLLENTVEPAVPVRRAGRAVRVGRARLLAAARPRRAHSPGCRVGERLHVLLRRSGLRRAPVD